MKVAGEYALPASPERAYALLQDPVILAKCIPGCEGLDRIGEGEYAMRMKIGIASISGRFDGKVRIAEQKPPASFGNPPAGPDEAPNNLNAPPASFRMIVEGAGKIGFMNGDGTISLTPVDGGSVAGGSKVQFAGDVQVGGTIANVGQRLIETSAKMIINRFFDNLAEEISGKDAATPT